MKLDWRDVSIDGGVAINTSLTLAETGELQRLATPSPMPRTVLEVGSAYGYSAVAMSLAGAWVTAVDPHTALGSLDKMFDHLNRYGVAARHVLEDSRSALPRLHAEGERFDLVFIDGDHTAEMVAHDVEWARKLLHPAGTLAAHDYDEDTCPGVRQALDALLGPPPKLVDTLAIYGPGEW